MGLGTILATGWGDEVRPRKLQSICNELIYGCLMGVSWGIVRYGEKYNRDTVITHWRTLALKEHAEFNIMHGTDRINFCRKEVGDHVEPVVTVIHDPDARARIDALDCGGGTYDAFEQLFDGYELFVPWDTHWKIDAPDSHADGKRAAKVDDLLHWMHYKVNEFEPDTLPGELARELLAAATVATELNMLIGVYY